MKKIINIEELKLKKKQKRKKRIRILVFITIIIYFVIRSIPSLITSIAKTTPTERISHVENIELEGVVLKNEKVYLSNNKDKNYARENGEKVRVGEVIGNDGVEDIVSQESGIVSYDNIDGLEKEGLLEDITLENIMDSTYKGNKEKFSNGIKVISGQNWKIVAKTSLKYEKFFNDKKTEGQDITLDIGNKKISGTIEELSKGNNDLKILISGNKNLQDLIEIRHLKFKVNKKEYEGLKVPNTALYKKGYKQGVFIKDIIGIVKFVPVKVLHKNEKFAIVEDEKNSNKKSFLKVYDEVFINSSLIRENQIYN